MSLRGLHPGSFAETSRSETSIILRDAWTLGRRCLPAFTRTLLKKKKHPTRQPQKRRAFRLPTQTTPLYELPGVLPLGLPSSLRDDAGAYWRTAIPCPPEPPMATQPEVRLNLWRVAGAFGEHPHAQKLCETVRYERDPVTGRDLVRVRFVFRRDLFEPEEGLLSPHLLFPEPHGPLPAAKRRMVRRRKQPASRKAE